MGYRVDTTNQIIYRQGSHSDRMLALSARSGFVRETVRETVQQAQDRIRTGLNASERRALGAVESRAAAQADQDVVLIEGLFDLRATWTATIAANGGRQGFIDGLVATGMSTTEATHLVDGLIARAENMQVVRGTAPLRQFDYAGRFTQSGGSTPSGGEVHHGDPLYLAGTHELLAGLDPVVHKGVHRFFDSLRLPAGSALPGQSLSPASLRAAVPAGSWRRGAATIHGRGSGRPGHIDYDPL
jgi:hypothetical protein